MDPRLHETLMELQQGQLDELEKWLDAMEKRIEDMGAISESLHHLAEEMEEWKQLQNDIMDQQRKVDSLQVRRPFFACQIL